VEEGGRGAGIELGMKDVELILRACISFARPVYERLDVVVMLSDRNLENEHCQTRRDANSIMCRFDPAPV